MALLCDAIDLQRDYEGVVQLHQDFLLGFDVLHLLLLYDVDLLHDFECEHLFAVLQSH